MAAAARTRGRSRSRRHSARTPSAVRVHTPAARRAGADSSTRSRAYSPAAAAKVAASSRATPAPPYTAKRPAPASGATSFMPSLAAVRSPLKSPIDSLPTTAGTSAASAASVTTPHAPYATRTANRIHRFPAESTASSDRSSRPRPRFAATRSGRRRVRSATVPSRGPASAGAHSAKAHSAARLSDPVRSFTQIPAASHMAEVPNPETTMPARRSRKPPRVAVEVDVMPGHRGSKAPGAGSGGCRSEVRR